MAILFFCACGARLRAESRHAGRYSKCPTCMSRLFVPKPDVLAVLNPRFRRDRPSPAAPAGPRPASIRAQPGRPSSP